MAIAVEKKGINIKGTSAYVKKTMSKEPRMIAEIEIVFSFPKNYDQKTKSILERSALNCPVHKSLSNSMIKNVSFNYN